MIERIASFFRNLVGGCKPLKEPDLLIFSTPISSAPRRRVENEVAALLRSPLLDGPDFDQSRRTSVKVRVPAPVERPLYYPLRRETLTRASSGGNGFTPGVLAGAYGRSGMMTSNESLKDYA